MTSPAHEVTSELAHDLLHDHFDLILALLDAPLQRAEVLARLGSSAVLDRMLRCGLVVAQGESLTAVARVYRKLRQDTMMTSLEEHVLPAVMAGAGNDASATLATRWLKLQAPAMRALRSSAAQAFFDELTEVSEQPADGALYRLNVAVIGTSRLVRTEADEGELALAHLRQAALQRTDSGERELALVSEYILLADSSRYQAALEASERFLKVVDEHACSAAEATYHLSVASHWRCTTTSTHVQ